MPGIRPTTLLDYALTAENKRDLLDDEVPEDLQEQKERRQKLQKAFRTLTPPAAAHL